MLTLLLGVFGILSVAATGRPATPDEKLREKISALIGHPDLGDLDRTLRAAAVEFIITRDNKVVVLDVETKSELLDNHIKQKLNYQEVDIAGVRRMSTYTIEFTFL